MLTVKIMHECVRKLIKDPTDEESLECMAGLLTTVGKDLDLETKEKMRVRVWLSSFGKKSFYPLICNKKTDV